MTRRLGLLAPLLVAVLLGALVRLVGGGEDDAGRCEPAARPAPRSSLSVGVADAVSPSGMQAALDRCNGPIAVTIRGVRPTLLAEHDCCGGRWIRRLDPGEVIRLAGGGVSGAYRVSD